MLGSEMALDAAAPSADEGKIQRSANGGAGEGDQAANPFLCGFLAEFHRQAFGDAGHHFFEHLLFDEIFAVIDSGSGCSGLPHFEARVLPARFEAVKEAEALNEAQRDDAEQAGVGEEGNHAAEAETRAFCEGEALGVANESGRNSVETLQWNVFHASEIRDPKAVLIGEFPAKSLRINFDGAESTEKAKAEKTANEASASRLPR
jgi:hypothetical protein